MRNLFLIKCEDYKGKDDFDVFPLLKSIVHLDVESTDEEVLLYVSERYLDLPEYSCFRSVKPEDIAILWLSLYLDIDKEKLNVWCVRLLRYIEINLAKLKIKEKSYARTRIESIYVFQLVRALFVEYYSKNNDLLFLNAALKISDIVYFRPVLLTPLSIKKLNVTINKKIDNILKDLIDG